MTVRDKPDRSKLSDRRVAGRATRQGVQSVEIGMRLVNTLAEASAPMSLKALSLATRLSPSKVHRYLASFSRTELVTQNPSSGQYDLGPLALRLGFAAQNRIDSFQKSLLAVEQLARASGHTAMVSSWSHRGAVLLRWVQGSRPVYTTLSLGAVFPLTRSATGMVFAAHLPKHLTQALIARETRGKRTAELEARLDDVRQHGIAQVSGDLIPGLMAMAAPVFDGRNDLVCALTLITTTQLGFVARAATTLVRAARDVSRELGAR